MADHRDLFRAREEEVRKLVDWLAETTDGFEHPRLVLIGGYALRAFVPFSRATRDYDFALGKGEPWHVDAIRRWLPKGVTVAVEEKREGYAFLWCLKVLRRGRQEAKISLDVHGRQGHQPKHGPRSSHQPGASGRAAWLLGRGGRGAGPVPEQDSTIHLFAHGGA